MGPARRAPKVLFDEDGSGVPLGGYAVLAPMLFIATSPSSEPAAIEKVTITGPVFASTTDPAVDDAEPEPMPFEAVTLTRSVEPTSAATTV
jgi:hypothetical protein